MGDSVEDLLAQIKAQYGEAVPSDAPQPPQPTPPPQSPSSQPSEVRPPGSIDDLLAQIQGQSPPSSPSSQPSASHSQPFPVSPSSVSPAPPSSQGDAPQMEAFASADTEAQRLPKSSTDHMLDQLKAHYEEQARIEELKRQDQLRAEQRRQEALRQKKRAAVTQQAEDWLKKLDPRSGEAAWFEEFAAKYHSRVEAAIDYLGLLENS